MTKWDDIQSPFVSSERKNVREETSASVTETSAMQILTPIVITTLDGRVVPAAVHQGSRSVYPRKGE